MILTNTPYLIVTGQYWKYRLFIVTALVGATVTTVGAFPTAWIGTWLSLPSAYSYVIMLAGLAVGVAGFFFACLSIRCLHCRTRLFWYAMSSKADNPFWLDGKFVECPVYAKGYSNAG